MTKKKTYLWKFLRLEDGKIVSDYTNKCAWKKGEWKTCQGSVHCCSNGFHASARIIDALSYVRGEVLAKVEVKGDSHKEEDKQAWASMRIVKAYKWTAIDSVKLSIFSAKQVIDIYEKQYPNDDRPRKAIEAAEAYLSNPTKAAARAAADAAADAAAYAYAAARAAAYAADAAYADWDKAKQKMLNSIEKWLLSHVSNLEEIE